MVDSLPVRTVTTDMLKLIDEVNRELPVVTCEAKPKRGSGS
jgi:hypothetical protein